MATIGILQNGLLACMSEFFDGWCKTFDGWKNDFIILPKQHNGRYKSYILPKHRDKSNCHQKMIMNSYVVCSLGLVTMLAVRDFDGSCIMSIAYQVVIAFHIFIKSKMYVLFL